MQRHKISTKIQQQLVIFVRKKYLEKENQRKKLIKKLILEKKRKHKEY